MPFVHLHNHSEYSMLDGLSKVRKLAARAAELSMPAIALTDHGVMHGVIEFADACRDSGVKPIIGMEGYLCKRGRRMQDRDNTFDRSPHHLLLLAMNQTGYRNLMRLATLSQLEGFYYKPRIDHDALREYSEGVICTSGCPSSEIPRLILADKHDEARQVAQWYLDVFRDRFYFEIQEHALPEFSRVNDVVIGWARELGVPVVATNDAHYVRREDAIPHDLMLCIQTTSLFSDPKRMRFNDDSYYLKSEAEMRALFDPIWPEAIDNTVDLANRCDVKLKTKDFHLPHFQRPARFAGDQDYLAYLCELGFELRYGIPARADGTWAHETVPPTRGDGFLTAADAVEAGDAVGLPVIARPSPPVHADDDTPIALTRLSPLALPSADRHPALTPRALRERLRFELDTITSMGFSTYMLIVWDLIRFCRESGIWWSVRGSAAGSMVSHVLMLTNIEPVSNDLYFERFLNPERVTMPDIDMDFPDDQRHLLVDYTIDKYGKDQVAQIITFGTMQARAALKDIGRVLDVPLGEVNRLTTLVPNVPGKPVSLREALEQVPDLRRLYDSEPHLKELYDKAILVEGAVRNAGTHAAGVVIADKPLIEYAPLHRLTGTPLTPRLNAVTQFEMTHLENIGLLKMDYLGLSMLTIIRKACELIERRTGKRFTLNDIPIHERPTYDLLSKGDVAGVFQVEGTGMKNLMMQMRPERFENIVAAISLFRPGPMEQIPTYIRRMHGDDQVQYHHPDLKPALEETYGIVTYQEQIMRVARDFAGYSMGEADTIRKAVSKKVKEQLDKHKSKFREGAVGKGYDGEVADKIWGDIEFFARYGFNKSHAAVYATITCQTAWLKATYPLEYLTALLTVESGNTEKIGSLIADAKKRGIDVRPPSVLRSEREFAIEDGPGRGPAAIRFGLMAVKNVGEAPVEAVLTARREGGPFRSLDDFCRRVDMVTVNKRALEALIKVGALDDFGPRHRLLAALDQMVGIASATRKAQERGQFGLFDAMMSADSAESFIVLPANAPEIPRRELLTWERELTGTYVSEHPLAGTMSALQEYITHSSAELTEADHGQKVVLAGVLSSIRPHTSKAGRPMGFGELEDLLGKVELTIFPRAWEEFQDKLVKDKIILVAGKAEVREGGVPKLLVDRVSDSVMLARSADDAPPGRMSAHAPAADASAAFAPPPDIDDIAYTDDGPVGDSDVAPPVDDMPDWEVISALDEPAQIRPAREPKANGHRAPDAPTPRPEPPAAVADPVRIEPVRIEPARAEPEPPITLRVETIESRAESPQLAMAPPPGGRLVAVVIRRSGDARNDIQRLQAVHQTLMQFAGADRFSITLRNGGARDTTFDFPNNTTRDCAELRARLREIGAECA